MRLFSQDKLCPALPNFKNAAGLVWSSPKLGQTSNRTGLSIYTQHDERKMRGKYCSWYFWFSVAKALNCLDMSFYPASYYNFYGSQMFDPAYGGSQVYPQSGHEDHSAQPRLFQLNVQANSQAQNGEQLVQQQGKGKGPAKAKKNESFQKEEEKYLINLWVSYHERLESKDSRKFWSKLVDELNENYHNNRAVEKCKRRVKYLIEKYKERKDWNKKQTGGSLWKSPFYDEIDAVLGVRDVVALERVGEAGSSSSDQASDEQSTSSSSPGTSTASPKGTVNNEETQENRRKRKKSKAADKRSKEEEEPEDKLLKTLTEQGDRMAEVIDKMQDAQSRQMEVMNGFMKAMTEMMKNNKS